MLGTLGKTYHESLLALLQHDLGNGGAMDDPQLRVFLNTDFAALKAANGNGDSGYDVLDTEKKHQVIATLSGDMRKRLGALTKKLNVTGIGPTGNSVPSINNVLSAERVEQMYYSATPHLIDALLAEDRRGNLSKRSVEKNNAFSLFRDIVQSGMIQRIDKEDLHELMHLCFSLTSTNPAKAEFTLAFGASEHEPTIRLPSYLLGSIELMRILQKHVDAGALRAMPQMRLYFGTSLGYSINSIDKDIATTRERQMRAVLLHFLEDYAPDVHQYVRVETDEGKEHVSLETAQDRFALLDERFGNLEGMRRDVAERVLKMEAEPEARKQGQKIPQKPPEEASLYDDFIGQIIRMTGRGRIPKDTAPEAVMRYTASHVDFFGDLVPHVNGEPVPDFIVSVGGKGEEFFNKCRRGIAQYLQSREDGAYYPHAVRIVQPIGKNPPYYNPDGFDPTVGSTEVQPQLATAGSADQKSIRPDYEKLHDFLRTHLATTKGMRPEEVSDGLVFDELRKFSLSAEKKMQVV
jgi:hypothetical protein